MKRIFSMLLVLIMLLSLGACGGEEANDGGEGNGNSANAYKGSLIGGDAEITVGETEATIKIVKKYKQSGLEHNYTTTITAPFTKDGDNLVFDFTKPETKTVARFTLTGGAEDKAAYLEILADLPYNRDPLWNDFCNGKEVSITTEGSIWGGIGLPRDLTVKLNTDKTFDQVYE
ncbi:MAG: hypothetical protein IJX46_04380 [Clostridia bacterium]|nr:hypothetical protein [Clostridia bacterium]